MKFTKEKQKYVVLLLRLLKELNIYEERDKIIFPNFHTSCIGNFAYTVTSSLGRKKRIIADVLWNRGLLKKEPFYVHEYYKQSLEGIGGIYGLDIMSKIAEDVNRSDFSVADISKYKKYFI